jgi:hypothetical protein
MEGFQWKTTYHCSQSWKMSRTDHQEAQKTWMIVLPGEWKSESQ